MDRYFSSDNDYFDFMAEKFYKFHVMNKQLVIGEIVYPNDNISALIALVLFQSESHSTHQKS